METKICKGCGKTLPISSFYKRPNANSYNSHCVTCQREMTKDWYARNREKAISKYQEWRKNNPDAVKKYRQENRRKSYQQEVIRKYGVDTGWFDEQIQKQKGACATCSVKFEWGDKQTAPHVDHCHKTSSVRGILCNRCNSVLGLCEDKPELLSKLARYLKKCHGLSATS